MFPLQRFHPRPARSRIGQKRPSNPPRWPLHHRAVHRPYKAVPEPLTPVTQQKSAWSSLRRNTGRRIGPPATSHRLHLRGVHAEQPTSKARSSHSWRSDKRASAEIQPGAVPRTPRNRLALAPPPPDHQPKSKQTQARERHARRSRINTPAPTTHRRLGRADHPRNRRTRPPYRVPVKRPTLPACAFRSVPRRNRPPLRRVATELASADWRGWLAPYPPPARELAPNPRP